jgi:hypothetical protein
VLALKIKKQWQNLDDATGGGPGGKSSEQQTRQHWENQKPSHDGTITSGAGSSILFSSRWTILQDRRAFRLKFLLAAAQLW